MILTILNAIIIAVLTVIIGVVVANNSCMSFSTSTELTEMSEVEPLIVYQFVSSLNVITNLLIAVPGLALLVLGFPVEGSLTMLCAIFSIAWHSSGERLF